MISSLQQRNEYGAGGQRASDAGDTHCAAHAQEEVDEHRRGELGV
jgi:hypothetical protein